MSAIHTRRSALPGGTLAWLVSGEGPPLLLIHSSGMGSVQFLGWMRALGASWRCIAPDLPGYGASAPLSGPFGVDRDVEVLHALVEHLDLRGLTVFGHSYGGVLALELALVAAERIERVAVYEPVAFGVLRSAGTRTLEDDIGGAEAVAAFMDLGDGLEAWLERFIGYWNGPGAWARLSPGARAGLLTTAPRAWAEVDAMIHDARPHDRYDDLDAPTLLLRGEHTTPAAARVIDVLASTLPHGRVERIEGAGHMGPVTHAAAVIERLTREIGTPSG